jgi:peroxiredoxin
MEIGEKIKEFKLKGVDGKMHDIYEFADKYALCIVFTTNSCHYSKAYGKRLIRLLEKYEDDNFGIIGINSNDAEQSPDDSFEKMKAISDKLELEKRHFLYLHDGDQQVAKAYGAKVNPEVFLFNSKRELVYKGAIDDNWQNSELVTHVYLEDAVEYCLDGIEVDFPDVPPSGCDIVWKKS